MGIECISWTAPKPTDRTGMPVNEMVGIPWMKGRKAFAPKKELKRLKSAIEDLADTPCCFWACDGPQKPVYMKTCRRCWALRELTAVAVTLERTIVEIDRAARLNKMYYKAKKA